MKWSLANIIVLGSILQTSALKFLTKEGDEPACKDRMRGGFSNNIMRHHCGGNLSSFSNDLTDAAESCEAATTPFLQRSLANKMFSHCGAWCIFDFEYPDKIAYHWNAEKKCYDEADEVCNKYPNEREVAKKHKAELCKADLCHHFVPELTESLMTRYCEGGSSQGEDRSPSAKGCDDSYTGSVRKALANHMFSHCGAWCLFDYGDTEKVSYAWDPAGKCWTNTGCQGHPELTEVLARRNQACEFTTTTTTTTSTSTSTTSTTTITSTSTTTTSTSTSTTTTSTTTITTTSTTVTTTSTSTSTTTTSTLTTTSTTTTSTLTSTTTSTTTTSTSTTTTTTSTSTTTITTTTSTSTTTTTTSTSTSTITSTSTTTTSTITSTTTTTTSTSTVTSTTTTTTSTSTTSTSTTTQTSTSTTTTSTTTITTTSTQTTTSTTTTSTTTTACATPVSGFSIEIMEGICGDLSKYGRLEYADAVSCEPATTPFVQRALANKMFSHCGAWCIYDYYQPDKISYHWDATRKCFSQTGLCLEKYKNEMEKAVAKKQLICTEEEPCVPVVPSLTNSVSLRYCNSLSTNKEDRSQDARGCHESYTPYVRRALANNLFSHCGAFCLYDFDQPDKVSYSYDTTRKCWHRGSGCQDNPEQKLAIAKKAKTCKADLCIPLQTSHSDQATLTYCEGLKVNGADRSGSAKACNSANTAKVHKALANKMYNHCGAWCLYDFERPEKVSYHWKPSESCWDEGDNCDQHPIERASAVARKNKLCKA
mmetsp:Transcript_32736/g.78269  ORF Transcript_32736/g.78269 Transcript_32736/m.78269 type:complete len:763 (-) Transcript_32736:24-2312(-)